MSLLSPTLSPSAFLECHCENYIMTTVLCDCVVTQVQCAVQKEEKLEDVTDQLGWVAMAGSQHPRMTGSPYLSPCYLGIFVCQKQHLFRYWSSRLSGILSSLQSAMWRLFILDFIVKILHKSDNKCVFNIIDFIFCFAYEEPWAQKGLNDRVNLFLPSNFKSYDHALGLASLWSV